MESKIEHKWTIYEIEKDSEDSQREQTCDCQWGEAWRRGGVEVEISKCKLLCIEWTNKKVLLYSTGDYIQHPVINHNGKEYEKSVCNTHIYKYNWITTVQQKLIHCKSIIFQLKNLINKKIKKRKCFYWSLPVFFARI